MLAAVLMLAGGSAGAQEFRAMWADAFHTGYLNSSQTTDLVAAARAAKCNALVVQVRKRGDAYYLNGLEPVATNVAGGYDPLADLLAKGHDTSGGKQRVEIHAWVVAFNLWGSQGTPPVQPTHPYNLHPDWLSQKSDGTQWDGSNYLLDPGHPAVQEHNFAICMDIVNRYNVDGIHFDYIRYPDSGSSSNNQPWGYNPVSVARYNKLKNKTGTPAANDATWLQWRRDQVTALVRKTYLNVRAVKPAVRVSASVITYGNPPADLTLAAWQSREAYTRVLQDWRAWMEEGILDTSCPMIYRDESTTAGFDGWAEFAKDRQYQRSTVLGLGWYLNTVPNTIEQIKIARSATPGGKTPAGVLGYSYAVTNRYPNGSPPPTHIDNQVPAATMRLALVDNATAEIYDPGGSPVFATTATIPAMPWKSSVTLGHAMGTVRAADTNAIMDGATVTLTGPQNRTLITDGTGFFGAVDLPIGSYTLTINQPGFRTLSRTFTVAASAVAQPATELEIVPFVVTSTVRNTTNNTVTIIWNSVPGRSYRVEKSNNLALPWGPAASGIQATGTSATYQWAIPAGWEGKGYLRVVRE